MITSRSASLRVCWDRGGGGHDQHLGTKSSAGMWESIAVAIPCGHTHGLESRRQTGALLILCAGVGWWHFLLGLIYRNVYCQILSVRCFPSLWAVGSSSQQSIHCLLKMRRTWGFFTI